MFLKRFWKYNNTVLINTTLAVSHSPKHLIHQILKNYGTIFQGKEHHGELELTSLHDECFFFVAVFRGHFNLSKTMCIGRTKIACFVQPFKYCPSYWLQRSIKFADNSTFSTFYRKKYEILSIFVKTKGKKLFKRIWFFDYFCSIASPQSEL